jgi:hypothetical protein
LDLLRHFLLWDQFGLWDLLDQFAPCLQLSQSSLEDQLGLLRRWRLYYLLRLFDPFVRFGRFGRWRQLRLLNLLRQLIRWHLFDRFVLCGLWHLCRLCHPLDPCFRLTPYYQYYR